LLVLALIPGAYVFNYFCGCLVGADPIALQVDTLDRLNQPPILIYTKGVPPSNITYQLSTGALGNGEPVSVFQYWFFWAGCGLAPQGRLCLAGHSGNDWEPLYIYWKTTNPISPVLLAVQTRLHFIWRQVPGSQVQLNGTQVVVKFALASTTILGTTYAGILPTVLSSGPVNSLLGSNATISYPLTNSTGLFGTSSWYYSLVNGGTHNVGLTLDPNSPPGTGPTAYEPGAGPADPFVLYGSGRNVQTGFLVGAGVTFLTYLILSLGLFEERALKGWLRKRRR
jgi:hypothetical protein